MNRRLMSQIKFFLIFTDRLLKLFNNLHPRKTTNLLLSNSSLTEDDRVTKTASFFYPPINQYHHAIDRFNLSRAIS